MSVWEKVKITRDNGEIEEGSAPVIISASRSTDIPGCYADWFMERIRKGYLVWINPFNRKPSFISFNKARIIVFWTKNPKPLMPYLKELDHQGIHYYFQYTLNDYELENMEQGIPKIQERIISFQELSKLIGKNRVIWRYDPLFLSDTISIDVLIHRLEKIGNKLHNYTNKLVFSFIDIFEYSKVKSSLEGLSIREFTSDEMIEFSEKLVQINKPWGLELATCGEIIDLSSFRIIHNRCIDGELMVRLFPDDYELSSFVRNKGKKDKGQRESCGCIVSKDIGQYNTCFHKCQYCYANRSDKEVANNLERHKKNPNSETITGDNIQIESNIGKNNKVSSQKTLF